MKHFYLKDRGAGKSEAWLEEWIGHDWVVVCQSKLIIIGKDKCLIDTIDTPLQFRRKGHATEVINNLKKRFEEVAPIGIKPSAKSFWDKMGMTDALGREL